MTVVAWGDAQAHGYRSPGGHAVVKDASGEWRYAVSLDSAGRPVPSSREVGRDEPPVAAKVLHAQVMARAQASHTDEVASPGSGRGKQRLLVILVSFADQGPVGSTEATWADRYFGASGSVAAYYRQNSFNKFRLRPAAESDGVRDDGVVGWLKLPSNHPNFGDNFNNRRDRLTVDALKAANRHVDFRSFDKDHDGHLSDSELRVTIIVAGYEASYGGEDDVCGPSVWGHNGALLGGGTKVDGVFFEPEGGSMQGEWMCRSTDNPGRLATIGGDALMHGLRHRAADALGCRPVLGRTRTLELDGGRQLEQSTWRRGRQLARHARRVLEVVPGVDRALRCLRPSGRCSPPHLGDQPDGVPAAGEPGRRGLVQKRCSGARVSTSSSRTGSRSAGTSACQPAA